jgi:hypothetical protein
MDWEKREVVRKKRVLDRVQRIGNVWRTCRRTHSTSASDPVGLKPIWSDTTRFCPKLDNEPNSLS